MELKKRFQEFFKKKGVTQKEFAIEIGYREDMVGRYLNKPSYNFIQSLLDVYPDVDLNYIFKEDNSKILNETREIYGRSNEELLKIIEKATSQLRANMSHN